MLWAAGQHKSREDQIREFSQADPMDAAEAAKGLLRCKGTVIEEDPIDAILDYLILARTALISDVGDIERQALDRLLSQAEYMLRDYSRHVEDAVLRLHALTRK